MADGVDHRLRAVAQVRLAEDVVGVGLNRGFGDELCASATEVLLPVAARVDVYWHTRTGIDTRRGRRVARMARMARMAWMAWMAREVMVGNP